LDYRTQANAFRLLFNFVLKGLANGTLKPVIDKTFPLENIAEAHRYLESNQHVGKVVVTVG